MINCTKLRQIIAEWMDNYIDKTGQPYIYWDDLARKIEDFIEETIIERMHAVPKAEGWISIKDQLPEPTSAHNMEDIKPVLLYSPKGGHYVGWYYGPKWNGKKLFINRTSRDSWQYITTKVTHWMPMPETPKENEDV